MIVKWAQSAIRFASVLALSLSSLAIPSTYAQELHVGVLLNPKQRSPFEAVFERFTSETGIKVISINKSDVEYKNSIPIWLLQGKDTPDVVFWNASQRLFLFAEKDAVHPITKLWADEKLDANFSHVKSAVTWKNGVYALPVSYYHWGLFYKKSLIEKFGGVPADWDAFLAQCKKLQDAKITPIGLGAKNNWPVAAWFDYLNLRINGLPFHQQLLAGSISFRDPRVQRVFTEWKRLIEPQFFNADYAKIDWNDVLPFFYRNEIAYTLIGNFVSTTIPPQMGSDIGFMPFPTMNASVPRYEEAPMDVILIPKKAKHIKDAEAFVKFMARADVQSQFNESLGFLPPNKSGSTGQSAHIKEGAALLKQAKGVAQYFDRDTVPAFEAKAVPILVAFVGSGNVAEVTAKLEQARREVFGK
jgi:multiple sugar transport system substrate-binding protein